MPESTRFERSASRPSRRIALFCQFDPDTAAGIILRGKAEALAALGRRVDLVHHPFRHAGACAPRIAETRFPGEGVLRIQVLRSRFFRARAEAAVAASGLLSRLVALPQLALDVTRVFRVLRATDVVLFHKPLPLAALYLFLLRVTRFPGRLVCFHDDWEGLGGMAMIRQADRFAGKILVALAEEWMPFRVHGNICASRILQQRLALARRAPPSLYLPVGASPVPGLASSASGCPRDFRVGYAGSFKSRPLVAFLAEVCRRTLAENAAVRFTILGDGEEWGELRRLLAEAGIADRVDCPGRVSHGEVARRLAAVDLCLLYLNDAFPENYVDAARSSTKLFEYMALGKPVVASRHGEPVGLLRDGETSWLCENAPERFADAIRDAARDPERARRMGEALRREFLEKHTHAILMRRFLEWESGL